MKWHRWTGIGALIIVLGEVIVGAVAGMAELRPLDGDGIVIGLLGVVVAIGLWWIYFEYLGGLAIRSVLDGLCFTYAHLPLLAGLVSVAVGIELAVVQTATGELERATAAAQAQHAPEVPK